MNCLITGASGFLGQHLVRHLSAKGETVRALYYKHEPGTELKSLPGVVWQQADLLDIYDVENVLEGIDEVYHCAGIVSFDPKHRSAMRHFNIESTVNLVNLSLEKGIRKLVHVSSVAALGRKEQAVAEITEEEEWEESHTNSAYGESKYHAEMEVWRGMAEGLNAVIVNPGIILGETSGYDSVAGLMKMAYKEFPFYTSGVTAWVDVKDVVNIMYLLMKSDIHNERFIVNEGNHSFNEILTLMAQAVNKKPPHIKASPVLTTTIAQLSQWKTALFGGNDILTNETARTSTRVYHYNNSKLLNTLDGFAYTPIETTINRVGKAFLKDIVKN